MKTIWQSEDSLASVKQDDKGGLRFGYVPIYHDKTGYCEFSLFSEVGARYQKWFQDFFTAHKLAEDPLEYEGPPYLADQLDSPEGDNQTNP